MTSPGPNAAKQRDNPYDALVPTLEARRSDANPYADDVEWVKERRAQRARDPVEPNPYDGMVEFIEERRRLALRNAAVAAQPHDPDRYGRAAVLAGQHDWPVDVVADNLDDFAGEANRRRLDALPDEAPVTAAYLADHKRMALAKDDVDQLVRIERALKPGQRTDPRYPGLVITGEASALPDPGFVEEIAAQAHAAWIRGKSYVDTFLLDPMLPSPVSEATAKGLGYASKRDLEQSQAAQRFASDQRRASGIDATLSAPTREQQQRIADAVGWGGAARAIASNPRALAVTIAQSLGQGAPALAVTAGASLFGPLATAGGAGGGSFAVEYGNSVATAMQREGVDATDAGSVRRFLADPAKMRAARVYATKRGIPVALFDAATAGVAGRLLAAARPSAASVATRSAGELAVQAGGGAAGELAAQVASGDEISPVDVLTEAFAGIPTAVAEVPGNVATLRAREAATLIRSSDDAARLGEFTTAAAESKLGQRSPDALAALVAETGEQNVYLSAEAAKTLFQSANVDPRDFAAQITGQTDAWDIAEATDGDLVIPAAKWAAVVARLPNAREFADHGRLSVDALSRAELSALDPEAVLADAEVEALAPTPERLESARRVEEDVFTMLAATGAYSAADSRRQAQVYGAVFRTLSARLNSDAWMLYEPFGLDIKRHSPSRPQRIAQGARDVAAKVGLAKPQPVRTLAQSGDKPRGRMQIFTDRTIRIELLEGADLSTFLHESAHFFWEVFSDAATLPDAPQGLRDDYAAALRWFGVTDPRKVTDEHLEQWARGFERYAADGQAPTPDLQSAFARFRAWLLDVYRDLARLRVTISPEIRGVFDRLLAADDEIAAANARQTGRPLDLGAEPGALGLSDRQWQDYVALTQRAAEEARSQVAARITQSQQREAEAWRKEARQTIRAEVQREIDDSDGMRALRILTGRSVVDGDTVPAELRDLKLDTRALEQTYGRDFVDAKLRPLGIMTRDGESPDTAAALLGMPSGDALVQAIAGVREAEANVEAETDARMAQRHPATTLNLREEAEAATLNDRRIEAIDAELDILARLANEPRPKGRQLRAVAAELIARRPIRDIRPHEYLAAERRAARKAARAAAKRQYGTALAAKRQQALNAALFREARLTLETIERQTSYALDLERPTARKRFGRAGLLEPLEQVLELYSFRPVSDRQRDRAATLRGWYDRMLANGIDPQVPDAVMRRIDESRRSHYRDLTPGQFEEVIDVLNLLDHQAREAFELRLAGDKLDLDASAKQFSEAVRGALKARGQPPASELLKRKFPERTKRVWRMAGAILLRMRTLAQWVDGEGNVDGAFHRMVIRPLDRAQAAYLDAMEEYGMTIADLFEQHLDRVDLGHPLWVASIRQNLTRSDVLAVALNTGNASNLQRMQEGRGWGDIQMMEILGHMTKPDWDFVQSVWDTLETLWPKIAAQQQRLTGVEPPRVEARPVTTPFGRYRGGYYPLVYDRDSTQWRAFVAADNDSFFDPMALTALPPNGHTKERVHRARLPVKLDLAVIPAHLSSILKDLTHRETVIGIRRLTKHPEVVSALNDTLGPEYLDMVEDKLRQVATDQVEQTGRSFGVVRAISRGVRRHVGIMAQGLSVTSGLKQAIGVSNSLEVMTKRHGRRGAPLLLQAYGRILRPGAFEAVRGLSGEMRHRINTSDADIRAAMNRYVSGQNRVGVKGKALQAYDGAVAHAYVFIRYIQTYLVDLPLWMAAHEGALKRGLTGDAAIAAADDAVITAQGAGGAKDTALIEGSVPILEWLTMFYSYGSAYLNRQVSIGRDFGKSTEGGIGAIAAELPMLSARALFLVALPVILDDLINQASGAAEGPGDDEEWAAYYGARMAAYLFYGIPGLRDFASAKYGYKLSPAQSMGDAYLNLLGDAQDALGGEEVDARKAAKRAVNVVGYSLGLPLQGPWRHVDYLWRVFEGEEQPESVPEFAAAAAIAKREQR